MQKNAALSHTIKQLNKTFGSGIIMRFGDTPEQQLECIPSGCLTLDAALGGGWARGRIVEVFGPESSGKTTLALHAIAEVQKAGGRAVLVDVECAFSPQFARRLGVNIEDLYISQPSCGEDALEVVDQLLRSRAVAFIAVDSVAALVPRSELEGVIGDPKIAGQARLMSHSLKKLANNASKTNTTVMFINQLRYKVGVLFGNPEITSGGNALKYHASQRVDVRVKGGQEGRVKEGDTDVGIRVKAKVVKNKVDAPYKTAEFVIAFNKGIDAADNLLEACVMMGVVQKKGSHYYYDDQRLGQGRDTVSKLLAGDQALTAELTQKVRAALQSPAALKAAYQAGSDSDDKHGEEELEQM